VSVPTAELTQPTMAAPPRAGDGTSRPFAACGRFYLLLGGVALAIGALSLLIPSTPSYDPWAWLVWGHQIVHGSLHVAGGPSWKPLPILFTVPFALFGRAQPDLWLVVARAGAIATVFMAGKLAWRLTRGLAGELPGEPGTLERRLAFAGPLIAAAIAAGSIINSPGFISNNSLGYSEGLAMAFALMAVDSYLDGHRHRAFVFGFIASLDRPELWIFWVPYGLWLAWRDPSARRLAAGLFVLTLVLWFAPAGFSGVTRANNPRANSAAFTSCPLCTVVRKEAWPTLLNRVKLPGIVAMVIAAALLYRTRREWWGKWPLTGAAKWRAWLLIIGCFGLVWWVGIGLETQLHFSGNARYLVFGTVPLAIACGAAWGWLVGAIPSLLQSLSRRFSALRPFARPAIAISLGIVIPLVLFFAWPPWIGRNIVSLPRTHHALVYQANLRSDLNKLVAMEGGSKALLRCGTVMTEGFQVPMVAWTLDVPLLRIEDQPKVDENGFAAPPWPNVILQDRDTGHAALLPEPRTILHWESLGAHYRTVRVGEFWLFSTCPAKVSRA
jgi:hypothetical protein